MRSILIAGLLASCLLPSGVRCEDSKQKEEPRDTVYQLSPVIISATQARDRNTPVTFSDLTSEAIRFRYSVHDIPVLLSELPSMTTYSENGNGIGYNSINLRGFDQRRISVMINGVPQNDPEDHNVYWIDFPDLMASVDNIQVQRGAGSAFYGPPAIGGSVNLVTNPFRNEPSVRFEAIAGFQEFGDSAASLALNTRKYSASFNSGLAGGQYMMYGRLGRILSDGYRTNSSVDLSSYFFGGIRFDPDMTTRFHFFGGPLEDGLAYYGLPKFVKNDRTLRRQNLTSWKTDSSGKRYSSVQPRRTQEVEGFSQPHYELIHEWRMSPGARLYTTLFYYQGDGYFDYDASWADTSLLRLGTQYGFPTSANPANTLVRAFVGNKQWGWLPRVEIEHGSGTLTVGAELRFHRSTHWGKIRFAENLPPHFDPDYHFYEYNGVRDIVSFFGHELLTLRDDLTLMGDLQCVYNRYGIRNEKFLANDFSLGYFFVNPRLGLNYVIDNRWNTYISLGYTSREPRMRNLYAAEDAYSGATPQFRADTAGGVTRYDFSEPLARPEKLFNLEIGARWTSAGALLNANVFWMEFTNELVKSGQVDIFGQPVTGNARRTRHLGAEVEGSIILSDQWSVSGNVSLSRNRLVKHTVYVSAGGGVQATSLDGNPIAGFPDVLGNLRATYQASGFTGSVLTKYVGSFHTDNFKNEENSNDAYVVCNLEFVYKFPRVLKTELTVRGEVRNLFNNLYFMSGEGNAFFPAAERNYLFGLAINL